MEKFEDFFRRASQLYNQHDYDKALTELNSAISLDPKNAKGFYLRGAAKYKLAQYESALKDFDAADQFRPNDAFTIYFRAHVFYRLNRMRDVRDHYDLLLKINSGLASLLQSDTGARWKEAQLPLSRLQIIELLGEGSTSQVQLATWNGRDVAIKTLLNVDREHAITEVLNLMELHHADVVRIEEICEGQKDELAFVMEYAPDGSLDDLLRGDMSREKLTPEQVLAYARDVASGLAYLHEQRVIHGNLKSTNVLLFGSEAKVADFGQSQFREREVCGQKSATNFMAPEVLATKQFSEKADVYSFGILLYDMCIRAQTSVDFTQIGGLESLYIKVTDKGLRDLIIDCCNPDPLQRPTSQECLKRIRALRSQSSQKSLVLQSGEQSQLTEAEEAMQRALREFLTQKSYKEALEEINRAFSLGERSPMAYQLRGEIKYWLGQFDSALEDLNIADELQPYDRATIYFRANIHGREKRIRDAYADFSLLEELGVSLVSESLKQELIAGTPLSSFQIIRELNAGSFGKVHLATWNGRQVALKTPLKVDQEQVIKEAMTSMKFRHNNVLNTLTICHGDFNQVSFVMEYAPDGSLYDLLYKQKKVKLTREQLLSYARDVASGLAYLHKRRVIHRDLKSANILLFENKTRAKICDFGQSRFLNTLSAASTVVGTPYFMAPEVLAEQSYNELADIYSFGVVLYEMCTNKTLPIIGVEEQRLTRIRNTIEDNELQSLVIECCKTDPQHRPTSQQCFERIKSLLEAHQKAVRLSESREQCYLAFRNFLVPWQNLDVDFKRHIVSMFLTMKYKDEEPVDTDKLLPSDFEFREEFVGIAKALSTRFSIEHDTRKPC